MGAKLDKILKNINAWLFFIVIFSIEVNSAPLEEFKVNIDKEVLKPSIEKDAQIFNLVAGPGSLEFKSLKIQKPSHGSMTKSRLLTKRDKYAIKFTNDDGRTVAILGLGDPFTIHADHIGYEDSDIFRGVANSQSIELALPLNKNISSIALMSQDAFGLVLIKEVKIK